MGIEIRNGLLRKRMSVSDFALRCGMSVEALRAQLLGDVSDEVMGVYAALEVEELEKAGKRRLCWAGKPVRNENLLLVGFDDGSEGRVRKKSLFSPRVGMVLEVEPSHEEGWWILVGSYRDNGVRLDAWNGEQGEEVEKGYEGTEGEGEGAEGASSGERGSDGGARGADSDGRRGS